MKSFLLLQKKVVPEMHELLLKRYELLKTIKHAQPVGRRNLSVALGMTERVLRAEVNDLKDLNLLIFTTAGMTLSPEGEALFDELTDMMKFLSGTMELEQQLKAKFGLKEVIVVSGNSDKSALVKDDLGYAGASKLQELFTKDAIIALTGGSTLAKLADVLPEEPKVKYPKNLTFVPARGGFGIGTRLQANTICEKISNKTNGTNRELYLPEQLSDSSLQSLMEEPSIAETVEILKSATIVVHGVGDAITMANKRKSPPEIIEKLKSSNAVGEVLGHYFDESGQIVFKIQTIGIQFEDLKNTDTVLTIAGGASKAKAIAAFIKSTPIKPILVTDESAAAKLLKIKK
ncbi:MAG: hypothetical protein K0R71_1411 [Bacillales bacterium]|jgi:central glycolytic genes regulator|nr:hypothetical protein [Bacillales bacterium]